MICSISKISIYLSQYLSIKDFSEIHQDWWEMLGYLTFFLIKFQNANALKKKKSPQDSFQISPFFYILVRMTRHVKSFDFKLPTSVSKSHSSWVVNISDFFQLLT